MNKIKTLTKTIAMFTTLLASTSFAQQTTEQVAPQAVQMTPPTTVAPTTEVVTQVMPTVSAQPTTVIVAQPATTPTTTVVATKAVDPNAVNINTASAAEIQDKLTGIGAKKAQAIVDYRHKKGSFLSIEQLKEVTGIGEAILDKNRNRIVLQ